MDNCVTASFNLYVCHLQSLFSSKHYRKKTEAVDGKAFEFYLSEVVYPIAVGYYYCCYRSLILTFLVLFHYDLINRFRRYK